MAEVGSAFVTIMPSARGFGRQLDSQVSGEVDSSGKKLGSRLGNAMKVGAVAAFGAAAAGGLFLKGAIDQASDLNETATKIEAIFGAGTKAVNEFAAQGAKALGQSKLDVLGATATFGTFGKAAGLGGQELAKFSTDFTSLATDLASFNNTSPEEAVEAIGSALRGEAEPLRQYGVLLDDATLRQEALRLGLVKTTKEALTPQQKVLAAQAAIYKQTSDAQGDFERTSGGLANQQRILAAQFKDLQGTIGNAFLPIAVKAVTFLNEGFAKVGPVIASVTPIFERIKSAVAGIFEGGGASGAVAFATSLVGTFNTVRNAVGGLISAFTPFVQAVVPTLVAAGQRIAATLMPAIQSIAGVVSSQLVPAFQRILPIITPVVQFLIRIFAGAVVGAIQGVVQAVKGVVNVIAGVFNLIAALVNGDWKAAWAALKQIVMGAVNAVIGVVKTWLNVSILNIFRSGVLALRGLWTGLWAAVRGITQGAAATIRGALVGLWAAIRGVFTGGVNTVRTLWTGLWAILRSLTSAGWAFIRGAFSAALGAIRAAVAAGMNTVRTLFQSAWNAIRSGVTSAFNAIQGAVSNGIGNVMRLVSSIPGRVAGALGNLGSTLYGAGAALIQGLINGISSRIAAVTAKMSELASKVRGFLPGSPIRTGPLKSWNNGGAGKRLVGLLAAGLSDTRPVENAMNRLASRVTIPAAPTLALSAAGAYGGPAGRAGWSDRDLERLAEHVAAATYRGAREGTNESSRVRDQRSRAGARL